MWIKDGKPYDGRPLWGADGYWIFKPTPEQFQAAGYEWKEPPAPEPPDMTDFNAACASFRQVCAEIGQLIGVQNFKGGFDEMAEFQASQAAYTDTGVILALRWGAADKLCTYEGGKVGLGQPEWWYKCWEDEA